MIYHFDELTSTNDEAQKECYQHGDMIIAERQSAGRGQRGNKWISGEGLNLTLSAVFMPSDLEAHKQFLISQATALALCDTLRNFSIEAQIKWTNDIYIGNKKIAGILIENSLSAGKVARSIVGIGLNVNQTEFDPNLPNPTSMVLEALTVHSREAVARLLYLNLRARLDSFSTEKREAIQSEYHQKIYRLDERHPYRLASGEVIQGTIRGVEDSGELIIESEEGARKGYLFKEIEFMIKKNI